MSNKQISLRLTDNEYDKISKASAESGLSITTFIKTTVMTKLGVQTSDINLTLNEVVIAAESLQPNTEFKLKALFDIDTWNSTTKSSHLSVGSSFSNKVFNKELKSFVFVRKDSDNSSIYKRI